MVQFLKSVITIVAILSSGSIALADFSCVSNSGTIESISTGKVGEISEALVEVNKREVTLNYKSSTVSSTSTLKMKKLNDTTFSKVIRGFCLPWECLMAKSILGYEVVRFQKDGTDLIVEKSFVDSPGTSMNANGILDAINTFEPYYVINLSCAE